MWLGIDTLGREVISVKRANDNAEMSKDEDEQESTSATRLGAGMLRVANRSQTTGPDNCFICGASIPEGSPDRTEEHVFPQWLLEMASLRVSSVSTLTTQRIPYRRVKVPCCATCNGKDFSAIEQRVRTAFKGGIAAVRQLGRRDLFLWLGKVYYGLIYADSLRPLDPSRQLGGRLVPADHLREQVFHHFLLQAASGAVTWQPAEPGPASFLIYECQTGPEPEMNFDYGDDLFLPLISLRVGEVGLISVLQDQGDIETIREPRLDAARSLRLHPTQFREVFAMVRYLAREHWQNQKHVIVWGQDQATATVVFTPRSNGTSRGHVDVAEYAPLLAETLGVGIESVFNGTGVLAFTFTPSGEPMHIPWPDGAVAGFDGCPLWPAKAQP